MRKGRKRRSRRRYICNTSCRFCRVESAERDGGLGRGGVGAAVGAPVGPNGVHTACHGDC